MSSDAVLAQRANAPKGGWGAGTLRRVLAVAGMTLREAVRRKVIIAGAVMTLGYLALYGLGVWQAGRDVAAVGAGIDALMNRIAAAQLLYVGLVPAAFIIALTAVFASSGSISGELDTGVMHGVLSRPIRRAELVLGKALGLSAMLCVYSLVINGAVVAIARAGLKTPLANWPAGLLLFAVEPVVLVALAMLCSVRLPTLASGVLCTVAYGIASAGGLMEQIGTLVKSETLSNIGIVSSLLMPVDAVHRMALSLLVPQGLLIGDLANMGGSGPLGMGLSATPSVWMMVYTFGYIAVLVWLATRVFRRRDL